LVEVRAQENPHFVLALAHCDGRQDEPVGGFEAGDRPRESEPENDGGAVRSSNVHGGAVRVALRVSETRSLPCYPSETRRKAPEAACSAVPQKGENAPDVRKQLRELPAHLTDVRVVGRKVLDDAQGLLQVLASGLQVGLVPVFARRRLVEVPGPRNELSCARERLGVDCGGGRVVIAVRVRGIEDLRAAHGALCRGLGGIAVGCSGGQGRRPASGGKLPVVQERFVRVRHEEERHFVGVGPLKNAVEDLEALLGHAFAEAPLNPVDEEDDRIIHSCQLIECLLPSRLRCHRALDGAHGKHVLAAWRKRGAVGQLEHVALGGFLHGDGDHFHAIGKESFRHFLDDGGGCRRRLRCRRWAVTRS
jgi:hypothetical protein